MDPSHSAQPAPSPAGHGKVQLGLAVFVFVLVGLFFLGALPRSRNKAHLAAMAQEVRSGVTEVTTVAPHFASGADLVLPGNIQAIEQAVINCRTSGYLRRRYVDIGSHVHTGQVLAEIESPEVDQQLFQAQADAARSVATVGQSQADVARLKASVAQSRADVARQRAAVKQADAQVASTQARLTQAQATQAQAEAAQTRAGQALEVQKATLKQGQAQLELATVTDSRYQNLLKQGFVAQQDVDQADATLKTAQATVAAEQSSVNAAQADVEAAQQAVNMDKAAVASAQADLEASKENARAARAALDSTQAAVQAAQASVNAGQSTVQANQAAVSSSQANTHRYAVLRSFEQVVAPFDGVITARNVDVGALISAGGAAGDSNTAPRTGLFGIARTDVLRIQVGVPQTFVNSIKPGLPAQVLVTEFPGHPFAGAVFQSAGALDATSRTLLTEVHIPNKDNLLRPGMFAQVQFRDPQKHAALRIPANTLIINAEGTRVAIVTHDQKVHFAPVTIRRDFGTEVEIATGLAGDEALITNPTDDLQEGMSVHATFATPNPAP